MKNPPISVKINGFYDIIAYTLVRPPISFLERPLAIGANYELPVSKEGIKFSGEPQEAAEEVLRELGRKPKYRGYIKVPEEDKDRLILSSRIASVANLELKLSESSFEISNPEIAKIGLEKFAYYLYKEASRIYSSQYFVPPELMSVPIVIGYGDEISKALAAAYAAHRSLPLLLSNHLPDVSEFAEKYTKIFYEASRNVGDLDTILIAKSEMPKIDKNIRNFFRENVPLRIVYFSPRPVSHGLLSDNSKEPIFLGSFVPEFRIPTSDLGMALDRLSESLYIKERGEILVIRTALEPDLTAYVPSVNWNKLESENKVLLLRLYEPYLSEPSGEEKGLDGLEKLVDIRERRVESKALKKYLSRSSIVVFEGPYVDTIETNIGSVKIKIKPRILVSPIELYSPLTITPIAEIPIEAYRWYTGFFVSEFLESFNAPAAMAGASNNMLRMIFSEFPISKEKSALMHMLSILVQGIGDPTIVAHRNDPTRIARNLLRIIFAASEDKLVWLNMEKRRRLKIQAEKYLKKSREFFYDYLRRHSKLILSSP